MISPDAEPIANINPYKRIELGARPKKPEPEWEPLEPAASTVYEDMFATIGDIYCG